jgi:cytidyltransferase-like protein
MVSGCFDLLHSGHIAFLQEAAQFGRLIVALGSDGTIMSLKGHAPVMSQDERMYMLDAVSCVDETILSLGQGLLDFEETMRQVRPDVFVVNEDGHNPQKRTLCDELGVEYVVLHRTPERGLPPRSTTALRSTCRIPFRLELAGGWFDQPFLSAIAPGAVLTISVEPTVEFNLRSGLASSTRAAAMELWGASLPVTEDIEQQARVLFRYDNPPGSDYVTGSQDALGIVLPGLNRLYYSGLHWPERIDRTLSDGVLGWLEEHLYLVASPNRAERFNVLEGTRLDPATVRRYSETVDRCYDAVIARDLSAFAASFSEAFRIKTEMFPMTLSNGMDEFIQPYREQCLGCSLSGCGGGGYVIILSDKPVENAVRVAIRRGGH